MERKKPTPNDMPKRQSAIVPENPWINSEDYTIKKINGKEYHLEIYRLLQCNFTCCKPLARNLIKESYELAMQRECKDEYIDLAVAVYENHITKERRANEEIENSRNEIIVVTKEQLAIIRSEYVKPN